MRNVFSACFVVFLLGACGSEVEFNDSQGEGIHTNDLGAIGPDGIATDVVYCRRATIISNVANRKSVLTCEDEKNKRTYLCDIGWRRLERNVYFCAEPTPKSIGLGGK